MAGDTMSVEDNQEEQFSSPEDLLNEGDTEGDIQEPKVEIPEKFKGKGVEEIIEAYKNLESEYGRRNNEIGELRKLTDELLELKLKNNQKEEKEEIPKIDVDSLLDDPNKVVNTAVENNPKIRELEQKLLQNEIERKRAKFESENPDWQDVMSSKGFQDWIQASPIRLRMLAEADKNFDYDTGAELLGLYKELNQIKAPSKSKSVADVTTETGQSAPVSSKKIYRRADLIKLRMTDPDKYDAMQNEIAQAYVEGRVR